MKRSKIITAALLLTLLLAGCGTDPANVDVNTLIVGKDGTITESLVESFDKEYYDAEELRRSIESAVNAYNGGTDAVTLGAVTAEEGVARTILTYKTGNDFAAFHGNDFFLGTVSEAYDAGYTFLSMKDKAGNVISASDVLELGEAHMLIIQEATAVETPEKIRYVSEGVNAFESDKRAEVPEGITGYIIY